MQGCAFKKILISGSESNLRGGISSVFHLRVNTKYFFVDQTMFLKLGQEAVLILAVVNRVSKAKTQVAVAVGIKEGICFGDSEYVEIKQANHRIWIMQHTGWEFKVCPFDLHIEGVQEIEVLDLVDGAGHILGSSCVIWSCPEWINTSAVFALVSHDGNFIQGSVGN